MSKKLTPKQQKFADEYIENGNATQAAINAGYSKKTSRVIGQENLQKPAIKKYIDQRMQEISDSKIMSAREAIELLSRIANGEELETVVMSTPYGLETTKKESDNKTKIAAMREILKRYPESDLLTQAKVRKANAEADIAEYKARLLTNEETTDRTVIIDDI